MRIESKFALMSTLMVPLFVAATAAAGDGGGGGAGGCAPSGAGGGATTVTTAAATTTTTTGAGGGCSSDFAAACQSLCRVTCPTSDAHEHYRCMAACNDTCPGDSRATCTPPSCDDLCTRNCHQMADDECREFSGERFFACVGALDRQCLTVCAGNCGTPCHTCDVECVDGCSARCRDTALAVTSQNACLADCASTCETSCCGGPNGNHVTIGLDTPVGTKVPAGGGSVTLDSANATDVSQGSTCAFSPGSSGGAAALFGGLAACLAAVATRRRRRGS